MKRLIFGSLSAVLLATAIVPAANAQDQNSQPTGPQEVFGLPGEDRQQGVSDVDAGSPGNPGTMDMNNMDMNSEPMQQSAPSQQLDQSSPSQGLQTGAQSTTQTNVAVDLSPFEVVSLARQGYFASQGIPSYFTLSQQSERGQIDGRDLVQAAIDRYGLSADRLDDSGYILAVERQLNLRDNYNTYF